MIVGIDLGTTHSLVACLKETGPELIPNSLGEYLTPSVVGLDNAGELLVGRTAQEFMVTAPERCVSMFKRQMGTEWKWTIDNKAFTAVELSALVLKTLKEEAEQYLGESVESAVITVPAYFNEHQRTDTIRAGEIAGLKVARIVNEPTAAALAYGLREQDQERLLLVYDLGGGTFDVSIVDQLDDVLEIRSSAGETFLGGEDFTSTIAARVLESKGMVYEHVEMKEPERLSRLRRECERLKRQLSSRDVASLRFPDARGHFLDDAETIEVNREQFKKWTSHLIGRADLPLRKALGDAGLKRSEVDEVILVGGATRMPTIVERIVEIFGKEPLRRINPDEVVALGAAVQAGLIDRNEHVEEMVVTDVAPFTLGVETTREMAGEYRSGYFMPIINRNTTIPVSRAQTVQTLHPNQTEVKVAIYQGEHRKTDQNLFLGEFQVKNIPRGPAGQEIEIRFTYDLNGVLEVEAMVLETKEKFQHVVTRYARGMSQRQIDDAIRSMENLKKHPREESANRYLLKRSERLYSELPWGEREQLDLMLKGFEEAIELQDEELIARHREALENFVNLFDFSEEDDNDPQSEQTDDW
ncbi:MAG: Hsp70 family protein [Planctomycetaceae bacterium]|nr:Hsp70 family protein [Planctomycetaceae bacterium]